MSVLQYNTSVTAHRIKLALVLLLLVLTPVSVVRSTQLALRAKGSWDFYPHWLASIYLMNGKDPYSIVSPNSPSSPIDDAPDDSISTGSDGAVPFSLTQVTNTPLLLFYIALTSWTTWETAKILWLLNNLFVAALIPIFVLKLPIFHRLTVSRLDSMLACLFFYNLLATKLAIEAGQTTLIIFSALTASLALAPRSKLVAGLLLGIALSKYTLAAPVILLYLIRRDIRPIAVAVLTQVAGFMGLALISRSSLWNVVSGYIEAINNVFIAQPGERYGHTIHLARLFEIGSSQVLPLIAALTLLVGITIFGYLWHTRQQPEKGMSDLYLLNLLSLWSLLVVYHGDYDAVLYFFFFVILLIGWCYPSLWQLTPWQTWLVGGTVAILAFAATSLYTRAFYFFFPTAPDITPRTMTISILIMLGFSLWLTYRAIRVYSSQALPASPVHGYLPVKK